ncbi:MAG: hypothetical protein ACE5FT_04930 [Candidatus Nanoarchaeia archaeon]
MSLVQELLPPHYEDVSQFILQSTTGQYSISRNVAWYYERQLNELKAILQDVLKFDAETPFFTVSERKFFEYAKQVLSKKSRTQYITFDEFATLLGLSVNAVQERIKQLDKDLLDAIKKDPSKATTLDDEYLWAFQNILRQISKLEKELEEELKIGSLQLTTIRKAQFVYKNLCDLVVSALNPELESIKQISDVITDFEKLKFDISYTISA